MAQFLRPDGVISQGGWTGGFAEIDEATANDADRAYSVNNPNGSVFEVSLSNPSGTPAAGSVTFRYRAAQVNNGTPDGGGTAVTLDVILVQGTTTIATESQQTLTGSYVLHELALTTPQRDAITDWNDLRIRFTATGGGGNPASRRGAGVSWAELEAPDSAASITGTLAATETGADSLAASGTVAWVPITGTLAASETGTDTASLAGSVAISGILAASEAGQDSAAATGMVFWPGVTGALNATESGQDSAAATGTVAWPEITGTLSATETGADTAVLSGTVAISGALAANESGSDTFRVPVPHRPQGRLRRLKRAATGLRQAAVLRLRVRLQRLKQGKTVLPQAGPLRLLAHWPVWKRATIISRPLVWSGFPASSERWRQPRAEQIAQAALAWSHGRK